MSERPSLLRLARRIVGTEPAAEDVAQSLWLRIQKIDDHPPIENKRAYLYRLARNLAADHAKADRRRDALFVPGELPSDAIDEAPSPVATLLDREALAQLSSAIAELSPRCREVLLLRRVDNLPTVEIARRLGISRQMVARYIAQAIAHCLGRLDDPA
jgi:RNA polymerase sigma-70 factor (ECF subfamily)